MTHIAIRVLAATAVVLAASLTPPLSRAASLGPPNGTYTFGDWVTTGCSQDVNSDVYSLTFDMSVEGGSTFSESLLRSDGKGAVKFSISLPLHFQILGEDVTYDYYLGGWVVMTFDTPTSGTLRFDVVKYNNGAPNLFSGKPVAFHNYVAKQFSDGSWAFIFEADFFNCPSVPFAGHFVQ
jgi:hypothetical protein